MIVCVILDNTDSYYFSVSSVGILTSLFLSFYLFSVSLVWYLLSCWSYSSPVLSWMCDVAKIIYVF